MTLISLADGLIDRDRLSVEGDVLAAVRVGKVLDRDVMGATGDGPWAVVDAEGALLAVYEAHKGSTVKPAVVVAPAAT